MLQHNFEESFRNLKAFCKAENYKGWDPYDGLNSQLFKALPFSKKRISRLAWIQLFKRLPINLRKLTGVKKDYNPKGLGLFLHSYCYLYKINPLPEYLVEINMLAQKVIELQSTGYSGTCWGYNFDWQARAFFQPKYTPTVVATTFIATALMEAYEITKNEEYLQVAINTKGFILNDLNRTYDVDGDFSFSYSPEDATQVFNASLLGSRLLAQIYKYTSEKELLEIAKKSIAFCCKHQQSNGAWAYGTLPYHQWIDNFHTGYNLECIHAYQRISGDTKFEENITKGLDYYIKNFFTKEGKPKYYNNQLYPIDIHTTSQLIITLFELNKLDGNKPLVEKVLNWTIENMQDKKGYFYYQLKPRLNSKIPYMRWAQAWMFYCLSTYQLYLFNKTKNN